MVACVSRDNARPPCKAWKWEEKEKGSVAAPASPPGANTETRDGEGGGLRRVSAEGKVKTMKEGRDMRRRKLGVLFNSDPP